MTVDYFSGFFEVDRLEGQKTASVIIHRLKQHFARHGIPQECVTDGGPPFNSSDFRQFAERYDFRHTVSSPYYSPSNGRAEAGVKVAKTLLKKATDAGIDIYLELLEWRNTPSEQLKLSPAQIMFGRRTRSLFPTAPQLLTTQNDRDIQQRL